MHFNRILFILILLTLLVSGAEAQSGYFIPGQTPQLASDEAETVYRTNLAREANGLPPLRWNAQLTHAARWFAWDSVENRPESYCNHLDTLGNWPNARASAFGYLGEAGAENAYCGYVTPQQAVEGWLGSSGHAGNLLNPDFREVGLGYYRRDSDGRGYVVQDFGQDPAYAPVVINNEALNTTGSQVQLYIYNRADTGGFTGLRPATAVQVSTDACFTGAAWQPYQPRLSWTLPGGEGWKAVYARTRDDYGYTISAFDSIYLGANPPLEQITTAQMSSTSPSVTLYELDSGGRSSIQISLGWLADRFKQTSDNTLFSQNSDSQALDGRALLLSSSNGISRAWDWTTTFFSNTPMVAYFRIKASSNTSTVEVARLEITAGRNRYPAVSLKGSHFKAAGQYQEFAVPFTYIPDDQNQFLIFTVQRTADIDLWVDAVTIFTAPQPFTGETMTVNVPGGNYRGQGVWLRYSEADLSNFTPFITAVTVRPELHVSTPSLTFLAGLAADDPPTQPQQTSVQATCGASFTWQVSDNAAWLQTSRSDDQVEVRVETKNLSPGEYQAALTFTPSDPSIPAVQVPVRLIVANDLKETYLPAVRR
jgi:uncharacterized protein YkwD